MGKKLEYQETFQAIQNAEKIVITTHRSPDGDAIGSSMGLARFIEKLGKNCRVIVPDEFPEFLNWIPGANKTIRFDKNKDLVKQILSDSDLVFSLDYNVKSRVGEEFGRLLEKLEKPMIMIDHHREPAQDYDHYIHDIEASSTGQLVYDFISFSARFFL